jgi:hypothetical protein
MGLVGKFSEFPELDPQHERSRGLGLPSDLLLFHPTITRLTLPEVLADAAVEHTNRESYAFW